jgi:hypothetical protein
LIRRPQKKRDVFCGRSTSAASGAWEAILGLAMAMQSSSRGSSPESAAAVPERLLLKEWQTGLRKSS